MKVWHILRKKQGKLITIEAEATLGGASELLREFNIGVLLVMGLNEKPAGIISERDIVHQMAEQGGACEALTVQQVMTDDLITCAPDTELEEVMALMTDNRVRHLPVLEDEKLVGLVSIGDVVKSLLGESASEIEHLRSYIMGPGS